MAGEVSARENEDMLADLWGGGEVGVEKHVHLTYSCICHFRLSSDPLRGNLEFPNLSKTPCIQLRKNSHSRSFTPRSLPAKRERI